MNDRCAVYARYSSDRQSPDSITDQLRKCSEHAQKQGWQVLDSHIYTDEAICGDTAERHGLKRLMAGAQARAFDIVLVDDTSRLSRKLSDALTLSDRLRFAGVRMVFVSQGIDSDSEQSEVLMATHGIVDSLYIKELAKKTHRGLEGKALKSLHTGGRVFGYKSVPIEDPERRDQYGRPLIAGARLEVDDVQAGIVKKIFALYASGLSIKSCAKRLNADRVPSPQPREGRQQSWAPSSVRVLLRNERYRGVVTWGRTRKVRNPANGRRISRSKPESEWIKVNVPGQRIVSEKLWRQVQDRLAFVEHKFGAQGRRGGLMNARAASSPYIFSGLVRCGVCGSNFVIVSGIGKGHKSADYGCPAHVYRGTCCNARRVSRDTLEGELLAKLQHDVLSDAAIAYCMERLESEIEKRFFGLAGELDRMRKRKAVVEAELKNLTRVVASGLDSPSLRTAITEREEEIRQLSAKVLGSEKDSVLKHVHDLRKFVTESLSDVRELLAGKHVNPAVVRQELAKHIEAITILPEGEDAMLKYRGKWDVIGSTESAEGQS